MNKMIAAICMKASTQVTITLILSFFEAFERTLNIRSPSLYLISDEERVTVKPSSIEICNEM